MVPPHFRPRFPLRLMYWVTELDFGRSKSRRQKDHPNSGSNVTDIVAKQNSKYVSHVYDTCSIVYCQTPLTTMELS